MYSDEVKDACNKRAHNQQEEKFTSFWRAGRSVAAAKH